jgi:protein-S-isoprenylcysteine O-methyltransferase Ste14
MTEPRVGLAALGAAVFFVIAPGGVVGLAPYLLSGWRVDHRLPVVVRVLGVAIIAVGLLSILESFARFVVRGHGTPAPLAPPKLLVVSGQYRHVRNPMYLALMAIVLGQTAWFGSRALAAYAAVLFVFFHLRVVTHEEPHLTERFGVDFTEYRRSVPRWIPRLSPWRASPSTIAQEADRRTMQ